MIRRFRAIGINGKISCDFQLAGDINVITGRNGSGKTTVLKAMWYLMSANIERIPREMTFDLLELEGDEYTIGIAKVPGQPCSTAPDDTKYRLHFTTPGSEEANELTFDQISREEPPVHRANMRIGDVSGSVFFPTFRRIEGGFSMGRQDLTRRRLPERDLYYHISTDIGRGIQGEFVELSRRLSVFNHTFVASISTDDIVRLLTIKYAAISEATNRHHKELSEQIISLTTKYSETHSGSEKRQLRQAQEVLAEINTKVHEFTLRSDRALKPFTTLSELVSQIFKHQGIKVSENVVLGDVEHSINSGALSSGEKQMLSFLCYNAFSENLTIFIDEPEISLHVDWQRILFPTLLDQGASNQFIIATHSPFIYTKYADKEVMLNVDRGDGDAFDTTP